MKSVQELLREALAKVETPTSFDTLCQTACVKRIITEPGSNHQVTVTLFCTRHDLPAHVMETFVLTQVATLETDARNEAAQQLLKDMASFDTLDYFNQNKSKSIIITYQRTSNDQIRCDWDMDGSKKTSFAASHLEAFKLVSAVEGWCTTQ